MKKSIAGLLLLFLSGCGGSTSWISDEIRSEKRTSSSERLCYRNRDPLHGVGIEFYKQGDQIKAYLIAPPSLLSQAKKAGGSLLVSIQGTSYSAYPLKGGEKCLLSEAATEELKSLLEKDEEVLITVGGHKTRLDPKDFNRKGKSLFHSSSSSKDLIHFSL